MPLLDFLRPKRGRGRVQGRTCPERLVRWAMKAEEIAAKFYTELENMVEDERKKRLMRYLSDMEWAVS